MDMLAAGLDSPFHSPWYMKRILETTSAEVVLSVMRDMLIKATAITNTAGLF
jgi:hypothetical protein